MYSSAWWASDDSSPVSMGELVEVMGEMRAIAERERREADSLCWSLSTYIDPESSIEYIAMKARADALSEFLDLACNWLGVMA